MPQEFNLMIWVIIAVIGVLVAFVIWNMAETDAKRAAYYNIFGPGGVLGGIALFKGANPRNRKKGTVVSVLTSAEGIIMMTIFIVIVVSVMIVFFGGAGKTSSELSFGLFDFVFR